MKNMVSLGATARGSLPARHQARTHRSSGALLRVKSSWVLGESCPAVEDQLSEDTGGVVQVIQGDEGGGRGVLKNAVGQNSPVDHRIRLVNCGRDRYEKCISIVFRT